VANKLELELEPQLYF